MFKRIKKFLKEVWLETVPPTGKVSWPDRKLTLNSTLIVIICIVIVSFYIGIVDLILTKLINLIVGS
ncbi:MAG: preprotein translocase subunit SecE [bacterium]|nr:preprotein translocase subunit SecE [bacterium]